MLPAKERPSCHAVAATVEKIIINAANGVSLSLRRITGDTAL